MLCGSMHDDPARLSPLGLDHGEHADQLSCFEHTGNGLTTVVLRRAVLGSALLLYTFDIQKIARGVLVEDGCVDSAIGPLYYPTGDNLSELPSELGSLGQSRLHIHPVLHSCAA